MPDLLLFLIYRTKEVHHLELESIAVAAYDEQQARLLASLKCWDEGPDAWLDPELSTCELINPQQPEAILASYV